MINQFRTRYSKDRNVFKAYEWSDENPCLQGLEDVTNLNTIYKQYCEGVEPQRRQVYYGDCASLPKSYSEAKDLISHVETDFYSLPANIRAKFNNKPEEYVAAFGDKERIKDFEHLGIIVGQPSSVDVSALSRPQFAETTQKVEQTVQQVNNNADFVGDK